MTNGNMMRKYCW